MKKLFNSLLFVIFCLLYLFNQKSYSQQVKKLFTFSKSVNLARVTNPQTRLELGAYFLFGPEDEQDYQKAYSFLNSAKNEQPKSFYYLGFMYCNGLYVDKNEQKALESFLEGAEKLDKNSINIVAKLKYSGVGLEIDRMKALELFLLTQDIPDSLYWLGNIYSSREFKNSKKATRYYKEAIDKGIIEAKEGLALLNILNNLQENTIEENISLLEDAANAGLEKSQVMLGDIYYYGLYNVNADINKAVFWYEEAAFQKNKRAVMQLSYLYSTGILGESKKILADAWKIAVFDNFISDNLDSTNELTEQTNKIKIKLKNKADNDSICTFLSYIQ